MSKFAGSVPLEKSRTEVGGRGSGGRPDPDILSRGFGFVSQASHLFQPEALHKTRNSTVCFSP